MSPPKPSAGPAAIAHLALVGTLFAAFPGCHTLTSTRSRVVAESFIEAPGPLVSEVPVEDQAAVVALSIDAVEGGAVPSLAVTLSGERRLAYEAVLLRTPVETVRRARASYVVQEWPHDAVGQMPPLFALLLFPFALLADPVVPVIGYGTAFSRAGDALDEGGGEPRDVLADAQGEACYVSVIETSEPGEARPTDRRERVERVIAFVPEGTEARAGFEAAPGWVSARADARGIVRFPLADLAALLTVRGGPPVLVVEAGGVAVRASLADPAQRPLVASLLRVVLAAASPGDGADGTSAAAPAGPGGPAPLEPGEEARASIDRAARSLEAALAAGAGDDARLAAGAEALGAAEAACAAAPRSSEAHRMRAAALRALGRGAEARLSLSAALALAPENGPEAAAMRAILVRWTGGEP